MRQLSPRQTECMRLVAAGLTSREIAVKLGIAKGTADNYISSARMALGAKRRADAIALMREQGLL